MNRNEKEVGNIIKWDLLIGILGFQGKFGYFNLIVECHYTFLKQIIYIYFYYFWFFKTEGVSLYSPGLEFCSSTGLKLRDPSAR